MAAGQKGAESRRIAFVQSSWHKDLVDQSRSAFVAEAGQLGIPESQIDLFEVTGAFEIPLHAKRLAESGTLRRDSRGGARRRRRHLPA